MVTVMQNDAGLPAFALEDDLDAESRRNRPESPRRLSGQGSRKFRGLAASTRLPVLDSGPCAAPWVTHPNIV